MSPFNGTVDLQLRPEAKVLELCPAAACSDLLIAYGGLMRYRPTPSEGAMCYDGLLALRQFGPKPADAAAVLDAYVSPCTLCLAIENPIR